jgi:hypothetical protein
MILRVLAAAALSAIAMFVWGFVFWGPVLNMATRIMAPLPAEAELDVLAPLRAQNTPTGMYVYPGPVAGNEEAAAKVHDEKMLAGPILHLAYSAAGAKPMDPVMFAQGLLHNFVLALLAGITLVVALPALPGYGQRVLLLVLVTLIAVLWTNVANSIWWFHTWGYCLGQMAYGLGAGLLMAAITAALVKPTRAAA